MMIVSTGIFLDVKMVFYLYNYFVNTKGSISNVDLIYHNNNNSIDV